MRIWGKRASEFSNPALRRMVRTRRLRVNGFWYRITPEQAAECMKVINHRIAREFDEMREYTRKTGPAHYDFPVYSNDF